jgi:membrane-associated HD superfamily phosphohydrolase
LEPDVSADAIMAHVVEGARILREGGVPEPVVEFAYTHHGTSVIEYFWHKCLEDGNPKGLSDAAFRYPGMRPRTKETAILMLIDAIEAAARTVDEPSREKFETIVQRVTNVKLRQGQLDVCGLTMEDIRVLQSTLTDTLCNAYHNRIKYPWQDKDGEGEAQLPVPGVATEKDVARERSRDST